MIASAEYLWEKWISKMASFCTAMKDLSMCPSQGASAIRAVQTFSTCHHCPLEQDFSSLRSQA